MERHPAVYLLSNKPNGVLYTGVTSNLPGRVWQHRQKLVRGFTARYGVTKLVYYELFESIYEAICREKQIKKGPRRVKVKLIQSVNPQWRDLYSEICG